MSAIGMMEGAYFVGRVELLNWLNDLLKLDYTKVEQVCSAAALCQIMDAIYPGQVPLHKVNFNAKQEYEFINNFKVLQTAFDKFGIDKAIDVPKLVKGKYQDNLEFLQWMKRYYDLHNPGVEYNAVERRKQAGAKPAPTTTAATKPAPTKVATTAAPKPAPTKAATTTAAKPAPKPAPTTTAVSGPSRVKATAPATTTATTTKDHSADQKIQELTQQVAELKLTIDGLEKERDFYFGKLREIEISCQSADQSLDFVQACLRVLYATDEQQEFVAEEATPQEEQPAQETEEVPTAQDDEEETF